MPQNLGSDKEQHLRDVVDVVIRRRRWVFICIALAAMTALAGIVVAERVYTAQMTVHIEPVAPNVVEFEDVFRLSNEWQSFYETQYRLIESRALARRVIEQEQLLSEPEFEEMFAEPTGLSAITNRVRAIPGQVFGWIRNWLAPQPQSRALPDESGADEDPRLAVAVDVFAGRLLVEPIIGTRLVNISWSSGDPLLAARIANAVGTAYIERNLEAKYQANELASQFLSQEIGRLQSEITVARSALQDAGVDVLSLDDRRDTVSRALGEMSSEYARAQTDRITAAAALRQIQDSDPSSVPEVFNNELIRTLQQDLAQLQRRYREMSEQFTDSWPEMQRLRSQMAEFEASIADQEAQIYAGLLGSADQSHRAAVRRENELRSLLNGQQERALQQNRNLAVLQQQQFEIDNKSQVLEGLLERLNQTRVTASLQQGVHTSNVRVVDTAGIPDSPSWPRPRFILMMSVMLGLVGGLGLALFQEYMDDSLKGPEDVERRLGLPTLALVPSVRAAVRGKYANAYGYTESIDQDAKPETVSADYPRSSIAEAFRMLRTAIMLSKAEEPPRVLLVTSANPGEGKTVVSVNLAICLAQAGKKVLLVDADMRLPRIHEALNLNNGKGLADYFTGAGPLHRQFTEMDTLHVLTSGPTPSDPPEFLTSNRLERLFEHFRSSYDAVVVDSPPLMPAYDAIEMARFADGVLVVVRGLVTPAPHVERASHKLEEAGGNVLGVVLNNMPLTGAYQRGAGYATPKRLSRGFFARKPAPPAAAGEPAVRSAAAQQE